ncbi:hypothetical protein D9615_010019 [Tricholomella constricta]|uniref:Uncharacterized protein n=1 Tax=Tricholomella constricta TaxID=117010 RepID=A0A8H5LVJ4_9AGAR|nr:hypothetical protein D9615_010019 [Tricholomella constricta]
MKFTSPLAFLALPFITCRAATITLFAVQTNTDSDLPRPSETFSPIGVGSDGATTYFNEVVASVYLEQQINGGETTFTSDGSTITKEAPIRTITSDPVTVHGTLVADASHFVYHKEPNPTDGDISGNKLSCELDGKGGGACVNEYWMEGEPTATSTFTGTAIPYYTLTVEDTVEDSKGDAQGGNKDNAASPRLVLESLVGWGVVTFGIVVGAFQVL